MTDKLRALQSAMATMTAAQDQFTALGLLVTAGGIARLGAEVVPAELAALGLARRKRGATVRAMKRKRAGKRRAANGRRVKRRTSKGQRTARKAATVAATSRPPAQSWPPPQGDASGGAGSARARQKGQQRARPGGLGKRRDARR